MKSAVILLLGLLALTADCIQESLEEDISLELETRDMSRHQQMIVKRKAVQIDKRGHKHDKKAEKETVSSGEKETVSSGEKETVSSGEKESVSSGEKESVSSGEKEKTVEKNVSVPPSVAPTGDVFPPPDPTYVSSSPMLPEFVDTVKELIDRLGKTTGLERDDVVSFLESMHIDTDSKASTFSVGKLAAKSAEYKSNQDNSAGVGMTFTNVLVLSGLLLIFL